ncbi:MAG TPA: Rho termination factor N-terminal domain-containing protein [Solirubrobacterales bacterium]|nr:Rho termination factor N-terminal domain-containing protein [Solirubrobacterales bacterium]
MTKAELESKHIAELHELAADAGVERYRMLPRAELIDKLAGGSGGGAPKPSRERSGGDSGQRRQRNRSRKPREGGGDREPRGDRQERKPREGQKSEQEQPAPPREPAAAAPAPAAPAAERPKRKRRRRRWGRRPKGVSVHDLLLPARSGRQAIVYAESRAACTAMLREVAAELSGASEGPDPIALLVDPTPEELADWKREAPKAEIVSAGKAKHAEDALAQARSRAGAGEDVIVLIDSLSRFAETFAGAEEARELFDAGLGATTGSLTVVAAIERTG